MKIHSIIAAFAVLAGLGYPAEAAAAGKPNRPNILWLIAEDFGPHLSCTGTKEVWTPNIDRLASEGVRYTHFYDGMVCSVSRSSFMTGMYAISIGAHNHRTINKKPLPEGVKVLTDWMHDAGYFTANLVELPESCGFKGAGKTDWNFLHEGKGFDSAKWTDLKGQQPFYAQINFRETHRDYKAPAKADPAKVELPPYYPDHPVARKDWAEYLDSATELDIKIGRVLAALKADGLADDTVLVFFGDNGQSHVRGKQFCYEEGFLVPLIVHWPKNFPPPAHFKAGTLDDRMLDGIDLAPTMMEIAGASKPPKMQGRVFLGEHCEAPRDLIFGSRDRCDETVMRIRAVRDDRYRYIHNFTPETPFLDRNRYKETQYPVWNLLKKLHAEGKLTPAQEFLCQPRMPDEELYDLQTDPWEIHNLAKSTQPEHQTELKKLRASVDKWVEDVNDQGRIAEPADVIAKLKDERAPAPKGGKKKKKQDQ